MDSSEFRRAGKELIDFIADHMDTVADREPRSAVRPNFLPQQLPSRAPELPEEWESVMHDVRSLIAPGMTEWQHPNFHGFYPCGWSFASLCGEMVASGLGGVGFSWAAGPAITELERVVTDWLGRAIGLPDAFLSNSDGGGIISSTASEALFTCMLAARNRALAHLSAANPDLSKDQILSRLVAYHSDQAHTSAPRAGLLAMIRMRSLPTDKKQRLRGTTLEAAVAADRAEGLFPFFLVATLGTTSTCAFDPLEELGPLSAQHDLWLHVDAAYAGVAFICPEFRPLMAGVEHATSFNASPQKLLLVHPHCSVVWYQDTQQFVRDLDVNAPFLEYEGQEAVRDYRHWQISFGRCFRALKIWFVMRLYGLQALREHVRRHCSLAQHFASLVEGEKRFEVLRTQLGLVCFRLRGPNSRTKALMQRIEKDRRLYLVYSTIEQEDIFFLRFSVCAENVTQADVERSFGMIRELADGCDLDL